RFSDRGYDREELFDVGQIGLLKAVRTFDPARGCAFSTYAVPLIFGEIRRFLRDDGPIKVSREKKRLAALLSAERERAAASGLDLRLSEIAERVGVTPEEAADALDAVSPVRSLSEYAYRDEGPTLGETIADEGENERVFDKIAVALAVAKLPALRKKIVLLRYYRDLSQQKVADLLGLTQVKVSREEKRAIEFLRGELS
ncbi:MAG: sigma-70 family RNA polymerase sigma factor, partial [Clostridia bacterium]|nr:sigma-70 family RNA polymerase sigma factor [Clostridia bacterium]